MIVRIEKVTFDLSSDEEYEDDGAVPSTLTFPNDESLPTEYYEIDYTTLSNVVGSLYEVDSEDDIADAISDHTGWLVTRLLYTVIEE